MRFEFYEQYTSGWTKVEVSPDNMKYAMREWCDHHPSEHSYHVCYADKIYEENGHYTVRSDVKAFKFQSPEDAMMFAIIWG